MKEMSFPILLKRYREYLLFNRPGGDFKAELLRRYKNIEKELNDTKLYFISFVSHHEVTMEVMEDLKCCGNCKLYSDTEICRRSNSHFKYCDKWQSDNLTREERMK